MSVAPQFSHPYYRTSPKYQPIADLHDSLYSENTGFSIGPVIHFQFNEHLTLNSGLLLADERSESLTLKLGPGSDPALYPCDCYSIKLSDLFLDIPLILKYNYLNEKLISLYVAGGFVNHFRFIESRKSFYECPWAGMEGLASSYTGFTNMFSYQLAASVGAGIEFRAAKRLMIAFHPSFEISLLNIKESMEIQKLYYLLGLNLQVVYQLN
ncbi:MAG: PorT family protein [Bacteroidales bacterium]|nr:PorT family protein [Bacteroidales bacterium]